jgi:hypothetical protein
MSLRSYFDEIKARINDVDKEIKDADKEIDGYINFVNSPDLFEKPLEFKKRLYSIQSRFSVLIGYMIEIEQTILRLREQYLSRPKQVKKEEKQNKKRSFFSRILRRRIQEEKQVKVESLPLPPSLEHAYRILDRLKNYYYEYEKRLALIQIQDSPEDKMRLELSIREFATELTEVCGEAKIYIISSLRRRKELLEKMLNDLMLFIMKGESLTT